MIFETRETQYNLMISTTREMQYNSMTSKEKKLYAQNFSPQDYSKKERKSNDQKIKKINGP